MKWIFETRGGEVQRCAARFVITGIIIFSSARAFESAVLAGSGRLISIIASLYMHLKRTRRRNDCLIISNWQAPCVVIEPFGAAAETWLERRSGVGMGGVGGVMEGPREGRREEGRVELIAARPLPSPPLPCARSLAGQLAPRVSPGELKGHLPK